MADQALQVRLAVTISGAVALGAYEGGALAALLVAVQSLTDRPDAPLRVDVMAGASAGSITSLLAARCLLEGYDPVSVMRGAWVEQDGIGALGGHDGSAPLSIRALREMAGRLLQPAGVTAGPQQPGPLQVSMAIACLRGLDYTMPTLGSRVDAGATTYLDWCDYTLTAGMTLEQLTTGRINGFPAPLETALASAANAMGFPPYLLDRSDPQDWARLVAAGITNLPASGQLWYTDGGTLDNEPLGRSLNMVADADAQAADTVRRLHVLIHPHPTGAPTDDSWADPALPPSWTQTAMHSLALQRTQSLFADLKTVEKINSQITWTQALCEHLSAAVDTLDGPARTAVLDALHAAQLEIDKDRESRLGSPMTSSPADAAPPSGQTSDTLGPLLRRVAGVTGKQATDVEVISPLLLPEAKDHSVGQLLAGEVLAHFGGFLDLDARVSDFDLGYLSTQQWLADGGLATHGLAPADDQTAVRAVAAHYQRPPDNQRWPVCGSRTVTDLLARHPVAGFRLATQITRVLAHDALHHTRSSAPR